MHGYLVAIYGKGCLARVQVLRDVTAHAQQREIPDHVKGRHA